MTEIESLKKRLKKARRALAFYADPTNYLAIGFFPDPPCGDFMRDFSKTEEWGWRPGKRARNALAALSQEEPGR